MLNIAKSDEQNKHEGKLKTAALLPWRVPPARPAAAAVRALHVSRHLH